MTRDPKIEFLHHLIGATFFRDEVVKKFEHVKGFLHANEGYALFLTAMHGPGSGAIVEIGSFMGRSTCFLALGAKLGGRDKVVAIDHFAGSPEHRSGGSHETPEIVGSGSTFDSFKRNLSEADLIDMVEPIQLPATAAAQGWSRNIRLLFIDGDHAYEATKQDFDLFSPFVTNEGVVVFHDVGGWPGVTQFCAELPAQGWQQLFRIHSLAAFIRRHD